MSRFVDPRSDPDPDAPQPPPRTTADPEELDELKCLCRDGHVYEVEHWIQSGRPLQLEQGTDVHWRKSISALEIALEDGKYALVLLLLCNGYDPNLKSDSPLDLALRDRRWDLLDLLLEWGADPHRVDRRALFDTYDSKLMERFRKLGVDLTRGHALAKTLAYHTSNKPAFGFAKRHREENLKVQRELDIALGYHAGKGNEKGVHLCLWAGADPHAPAPSLGRGRAREEDDEEASDKAGFIGFSAIYEACLHDQAEILELLGPDPALDDFDDLYRAADDSAVIRQLAESALATDAGSVICAHVRQLSWNLHRSAWQSLWALETLFEVGMRWEESSPDTIAAVRHDVRRTSDRTFVDLVKLLTKDAYCSPEILRELARTPAFRRRLTEVGFLPSEDDAKRHDRPTRSRQVLRKLGIELPKPPPHIPRVVRIGQRRSGCQEVRLTRHQLFDGVWTTPVVKLAEEWGLSDRGLAKACRRLQIPLPPRGFWARKRAGQRVRRPELSQLQPGQAEEIRLWAPE